MKLVFGTKFEFFRTFKVRISVKDASVGLTRLIVVVQQLF